MTASKKELLEMLNRALELEHAARIQYLAHAELVKGPNAEAIIARLREIAKDEEKHEEMFREMIATYLEGVPSMGIAKTYPANTLEEIINVNLKGEMEAVDFYLQIMDKLHQLRSELKYEYLQLEHKLRLP